MLGFNTDMLRSKRDQLVRDQPMNDADAEDDSWNGEDGHERERE
jgi:hypothetical protein